MTALLSLVLIGCGDQYRYPCQNPDNWNSQECQLPRCEAAQVCTKDVLNLEQILAETKASQQAGSKK